jgi:nitrite reductase/ring-hydroxylating ferredoxin subunit
VNPARPVPGTVICKLDDLPVHGAKGFVWRLTTAIFQGFIVRDDDVLHGYVDRCPHAGWPMSVLPDRYLTKDGSFVLCSSHGALFEKDTGKCIAGPCIGDRLEAWPVEVHGDEVRAA